MSWGISFDGTDSIDISAAGGRNADRCYAVDPMTVQPGGSFDVVPLERDEFESESWFFLSNAGGTELNGFHTSCSQDLAVGDVFGSLTLVGINGQGGGDIVAARAGANRLKSETFVHIFDEQTGAWLQTINFHTSCPKALSRQTSPTPRSRRRVAGSTGVARDARA